MSQSDNVTAQIATNLNEKDPSPVTHRDLEPMFVPRSIAVVGASRTPGTAGNAIVQNLIYGGYTGVIYPVNPKARSIMGIACAPKFTAIQDQVDLAIIVVPAPVVEETILNAADSGTRHFVVISAGFKETGGEGIERESRLRRLARQRDLSILGPNCLGLINTAPNIRMNGAFGRQMPIAGHLGLISQSGALSAALLDYARGREIGFSRFVSFGNKVDIDETDLLRTLASDENTKVILMYLEDLSSGQEFLHTAYEITHGQNPKPILAMKSGRTAQGAAAAASHTGSMAGSDEVYDAIMAQAGVIRVESVEDIFDYAEVFCDTSLPTGRSTAIVTNAGGPGIMATDACIRYGLKLAQLSDYTAKSLHFQMPATSSIKNPVDVIGDAKHDRYRAALDAVVADENVDQVMVLVTPQSMTNIAQIAEVIGETREFCPKPIVACMMGLVDVAPGIDILRRYGVPTFAFPENGMRALAAKCRYAEWISAPRSDFRTFDVDRSTVTALLNQETAAHRFNMVEGTALKLLAAYGFSTVPFTLARSADEAVSAATAMGYPVVMKISSPTILHKTDIGGVCLNLRDETAVRTAFSTMIKTVQEKLGNDIEIWGVLIQKMLPPGQEIILGMTRDECFGPLLMFGLGGIYTEALHDVIFRLAPIRVNSARKMIEGIRSHRLLEGMRGKQPCDVAAIVDALCRLSQLVTDFPQIKELDVNPLIVYPQGQGTIVADARIILAESKA